MEPSRFFSPRQRLAAYAAEQGRCAHCGAPLQPGFHADHVTPASQGGPTDVTNAQALCPRCNARKAAGPNIKAAGPNINAGKGAKENQTLKESPAARTVPAPPTLPPSPQVGLTPALPTWTKPLRAWQERAFVQWRRLQSDGQKDVLVTATPGSGKSLLAARILHEQVTTGRADRIVVVVPSQVLKRQWAAVAHAVGLRLAASWGNDAVVLPPDAHGVITTYAQVARLPEALRIQCARHKVFVCLDELHHAGQGLAWGDGIAEAFEHAIGRLCLSGTAWRGDAASIPFVRYDAEGRSLADISYGYAEALGDQVVREVYFFTRSGQVRWLDGQGEQEATFADDLHPERMARRLRAALDAGGGWLPAVLRQAAGALEEVRQGHARAKGLIVCMDGFHARAVADLAYRVTGEQPVVALSDDTDAAQALASFRTGNARWLVVCRMAGEGYDCPDLRVCLWATNQMTELSFRQIVARTVRMIEGLAYQDAQVFLPADPRLLSMAQAMLSERAQALGGPQPDREARVPGVRAGMGSLRTLFVPLSSEASEGNVISGGAEIPAEALRRAEAFRSEKPALSHLPAHFIATIFSHLEPHQMPEMPLPPSSEAVDPAQAPLDEAGGYGGQGSYDDVRLQKRRACSRLAAIVARAAGIAVEAVHRDCHQRLGVRQAEASLADLERKERLLIARLKQLQGV